MAAPAAPRRLDAETRREQLLAAAEALFIERGFEGVGMNDVARALGTSRPTVYTYFTSTADLLGALLEARLPALWNRLRPLLDHGTTTLDFRAVFHALLCERELLLLLHSGGGPLFRRQRQHFLAQLGGLLEPYRADQTQRPVALHIVTLLLETVAVEALRYPDSAPDDLEGSLGAFIAGGLGALNAASGAGLGTLGT